MRTCLAPPPDLANLIGIVVMPSFPTLVVGVIVVVEGDEDGETATPAVVVVVAGLTLPETEVGEALAPDDDADDDAVADEIGRTENEVGPEEAPPTEAAPPFPPPAPESVLMREEAMSAEGEEEERVEEEEEEEAEEPRNEGMLPEGT